jgi:hypothetical protein
VDKGQNWNFFLGTGMGQSCNSAIVVMILGFLDPAQRRLTVAGDGVLRKPMVAGDGALIG